MDDEGDTINLDDEAVTVEQKRSVFWPATKFGFFILGGKINIVTRAASVR